LGEGAVGDEGVEFIGEGIGFGKRN